MNCAQYFIAKTVQDNQYVVLLANKIFAGPFVATAAEAVKARDALLAAGSVDVGAISPGRVVKA